MTLIPGARLRSQVCETEIIMTRPPVAPLVLHCGGAPMVPFEETISAVGAPAVGWDGGSKLGKRYTSAGDDSLEVLVTREGTGTLSDGDNPLLVKESKPLPSSD